MASTAMTDDLVSIGARRGLLRLVSGRLTPGRHPMRATARTRISQFAEANSMFGWFRFLASPR